MLEVKGLGRMFGETACAAGKIWSTKYNRCVPDCPGGYFYDPFRYRWDTTVYAGVPKNCYPICQSGSVWNADQGRCVSIPITPASCGEGYRWDPVPGGCVSACNVGSIWDRVSKQCIPLPPPLPPVVAPPEVVQPPPVTVTPTTPGVCPAGLEWHPRLEICYAPPTNPTPPPPPRPAPDPTCGGDPLKVWNPAAQVCVAVTEPTPQPTPQPTTPPTPQYPDFTTPTHIEPKPMAEDTVPPVVVKTEPKKKFPWLWVGLGLVGAGTIYAMSKSPATK